MTTISELLRHHRDTTVFLILLRQNQSHSFVAVDFYKRMSPCDKEGFDGYVTKPIEWQEFHEQMGRLFAMPDKCGAIIPVAK